MSTLKETRDVYYIPPNFLTTGRLFGGSIRIRNAIEATVLVVLTGLPIIRLPFSLTVEPKAPKVDIESEKVDIESLLSQKGTGFSVKTIVHVHRLFDRFGSDGVFGQSAVVELLALQSSSASKLIAKLLQVGIIEPVSGQGKGKYRFSKS